MKIFICFTDTNQNQQTILRQQKFLTSILDRLITEEAVVLSEIEEVRIIFPLRLFSTIFLGFQSISETHTVSFCV